MFTQVPGDWGIYRDEQGYARAITKGGEYFAIHLETGTVRNEANIEAFVGLLNSLAKEVQAVRAEYVCKAHTKMMLRCLSCVEEEVEAARERAFRECADIADQEAKDCECGTTIRDRIMFRSLKGGEK